MIEIKKSDAGLEAFHKELEKTCRSGEDVFKQLCNQMIPKTGKEELSEEDLDLVSGGMSDMQALEVVSTAYWDLCVKKKGSTKYSDLQIYEALNSCHRLNRWNQNGLEDIGKVTSLLMKELNS